MVRVTSEKPTLESLGYAPDPDQAPAVVGRRLSMFDPAPAPPVPPPAPERERGPEIEVVKRRLNLFGG